MQHLHRHLRSQSAVLSNLIQQRSKFSAGSFFHQDEREQTQRAKRQKRRAQKNVLRNWQNFCGNAEWHRDDEVHTAAHNQQTLERAEKKLLKWLVGQTRTLEATRKQKKGWLKWLKQGGAAQMGRERSRQPERDPHGCRGHFWGPISGASSGETTFGYTWTENLMQNWNMSGGEGYRQAGSDPHWTYDHEAWSHCSGSSSQHSDRSHGQRQPSRQTAADSARSQSLRLLGLSHSVTLTSVALQEAFRKCALTWHPDRHSGAAKRAAEEKFKEIQAAYQLLKASNIA